MAEISYKREFEHKPWVDNQDIVAAEGENGFNVRFQALEAELDKIAAVFDDVGGALREGLGVRQVAAIFKIVAADEVTEPEEVEVYDDADFPEGVRKIYQVAIETVGAFHGQVSTHFIYQPAGAGQTRVSVWFKNERNQGTRFNARIYALNSPPEEG